MNLRERLRLLKAAGAARTEEPAAQPFSSGPPTDSASPAATVRHGGEVDGGAPTPHQLAGQIPGYLVTNPSGQAFYTEHRYPIDHQRGPLPLAHLFGLPTDAWSQLGPLPPHLDLRQAVFFDTETTGLAGGTGTYAFLIGLGFFQGEEFVIRQYFMRDYPDEEAMLEAITADLQPFSALVSFNGKSFDWPLLETRFRMSRRRVPLAGAPHLDLLHPARRLWKLRLESCNLQRLEGEILGVHRQGDVPGHLIPALYFDYLRTGVVSELDGVIEHNRLDILSLVSLAGWMGHVTLAPLEPTPDGELLCGDDLFSLGRLYESRGELAKALTCYEAARQRGVGAVSEAVLLRQLSTAYKRAKEQEQAVAIWEEMIQSRAGLSLFPYLELAKYHEHVTRRYDLAEAMTRAALAAAEQRRSLVGLYGPSAQRDYQAIQHRLQRLLRKQARATS